MQASSFIPPEKYKPKVVEIPNQSPYKLDEKVGWYRMEDGSQWMLTWRPHGGLLGLNFVDFANDNIHPQSESEFIWIHQGDSLKITFVDSAGMTQKFVWTDSAGTHMATRMSKPYYTQKELAYRNGNFELKGTLMIPHNQPVQAAVVIIHGSGTSHRDNFWYLYQTLLFSQKWYYDFVT